MRSKSNRRRHSIEDLERRTLLSITEPKDSLTAAFAIPGGDTFGGSMTFTDSIGASPAGDVVDFYRIPEQNFGPLAASLSHLSIDLNLFLIHDLNNNGVE